jgi:hypothetical protein
MLILSDLKTAIAGFAGEILRSGHFRWRAPSSTSCAVLLPTQLLPIKHRKSSALSSSSSSLFLITIYKYTFVRYPLFQASSPQRAEHIPSTFVHKRTYNTSESYSFANTTTHTHTHTHTHPTPWQPHQRLPPSSTREQWLPGPKAGHKSLPRRTTASKTPSCSAPSHPPQKCHTQALYPLHSHSRSSHASSPRKKIGRNWSLSAQSW